MKVWLCSKCRRGQELLRIGPAGKCELCRVDLGEAVLGQVDDPGIVVLLLAGKRHLARGTYTLQERPRP